MSLFGVVAFYARQDKSDGGGKHFMLRPESKPTPPPPTRVQSTIWAAAAHLSSRDKKGWGCVFNCCTVTRTKWFSLSLAPSLCMCVCVCDNVDR